MPVLGFSVDFSKKKVETVPTTFFFFIVSLATSTVKE